MAAPKNETRVPADEPVIAFARLLDAPRVFVWKGGNRHLDRLQYYLAQQSQ